MNKTDVIDSKIKHIKNTFKGLLKENNFKRDKQLVEIIDALIYCNNLNQDKKLLKKITELSTSIDNEQADDIDVINYNVWLKSLL